MTQSPSIFNTQAVSSIPVELRERNQWLCWNLTECEGRLAKLPYQAKSNGTLLNAKSNDPATWSDLASCVATTVRLNLSGIGFALSESDGLAGLDLDHVIDPVTGELDPLALEVLEHFAGTYAEISPSGEGIRIFCYGKLARSGKCVGTRKWLEAYASIGRYLTVTGNQWPGSANAVTEKQDALDWLHGRFMDKSRTESTGEREKSRPSSVESLDDNSLLDKARNARNGGDFDALWSGDTSRHNGDHSAADLALLNILAFWTRKDSARMNQLFRQSGLMRDKWDVLHDGERTYGEMSIERAINDCREEYSGGKKSDNARRSNSDAAELKLGSKNEILARTGNLSILLEHDTQWRGVIAYNEFRQRIEKRIDPPYKGKIGDWLDNDTVETRVWLDQNKDVNFSKGDVDQVVMMIAHRKRYNPAQDALRAMADQWDNQSRINSWLVDYLNAECDDSNRTYLSEIGSCWLKGVAARVLMPGCKRDDVLVLKGEQGYRKSTAASIIADAIHPNSFTDTLPELKSEEVKLALHGMIIVEFAELAAINKSEIEVIKSFVTSKEDHVRGKYAIHYRDYPRTCSFIGTTNDETFLKDPTGNRRWWPVKITRVIDTDRLQFVVRQLLGEAAHRVIAGEPWHVTNDEAHQQAAVIRQDSFQDDVWKDDCLAAFHRLKEQVDHIQTADILREMGIKIEQHSKQNETRINQIMRSSGYEYKNSKVRRILKKAWVWKQVTSTTGNPGNPATGSSARQEAEVTWLPEVTSTFENFKEDVSRGVGGGGGGVYGEVAGKEYGITGNPGNPGNLVDSKGESSGNPSGNQVTSEVTSSPVESDGSIPVGSVWDSASGTWMPPEIVIADGQDWEVF